MCIRDSLYYLEAVATLRDLITKAGYAVRIGSINPAVTEAQDLALPSGKSLRLEPLKREDDRVYVEGFKPCVVLLHNDLSGGRPAILEGLKQPVVPHPKLGWSDRLKSQHFAIYQEVCEDFAEQFGIDPWLVNPLFRNCGEINFLKRARARNAWPPTSSCCWRTSRPSTPSTVSPTSPS